MKWAWEKSCWHCNFTRFSDFSEKAEIEAQEAAEAAKIAEAERQKQEEQRRQIQDALNSQSYNEFRKYAEQQYPDNPDQQGILIRQLQEQHYYQYMQQAYQQQLGTPQDSQPSPVAESTQVDLSSLKISEDLDDPDEEDHEEDEEDEVVEEEDEEHFDYDQDDDVAPASMWTKKELPEFKESIRKEGGDSIIKVSHGETVTVRVPTHKDGSALFWEFATDHYDIAFGLFFEWTETEETEVSVHISDSEDEDLDDDYHDDEDVSGDPENATRALVEKGPPTSVIVPIFRRDCHTEVYAGTHNYPGRGVYLLKFDNTYSLWRSKTLYYR